MCHRYPHNHGSSFIGSAHPWWSSCGFRHEIGNRPKSGIQNNKANKQAKACQEFSGTVYAKVAPWPPVRTPEATCIGAGHHDRHGTIKSTPAPKMKNQDCQSRAYPESRPGLWSCHNTGADVLIWTLFRNGTQLMIVSASLSQSYWQSSFDLKLSYRTLFLNQVPSVQNNKLQPHLINLNLGLALAW
jgi:hypothetical protein